MYKVVKNKNFLNLLVGGGISKLGTLMQDFALSLYVLYKTGSATQFASILALVVIPSLFLSPIAGYVADKVNKKKWMVLLDCLSGVTVFIFGLIFLLNDSWNLGEIYTFVIILAVIHTFSGPIDTSARPLIIEKEDLGEANSLLNTVDTIVSFIAGILGGVLYGAFGIFFITALNGVSFIILAIMECFIVIPEIEESKKPKALISGIKEGFIFVKEDKRILTIVTIASFMNFCLSSIGIGIIIIGNKLLKLQPWELGLFQSSTIIGSLLGAILMPVLCKKVALENVIYRASVIMSVFFVAFGSWTYLLVKLEPIKIIGFIVTLIFMIIIIAIVVVLSISLSTFTQSTIPSEMMGRAGSFLGMMSMAMKPVGDMFHGFAFDKIGYSFSFLLSSGVMSVMSIIQRRQLPKEKTSDIILER